MVDPAYIIADDHVTVVLDDGVPLTVYAHQSNFSLVLEAIQDEDWETFRALATPAGMITQFGEGLVTVSDGVVCYNNEPLHNSLTTRILKMFEEGFDVGPMVHFLNNLMDNPSKRAVDELYCFLEYGSLPITKDGHFLAYKKVRGDYFDIYSGTMNNSPGEVVTMPRNQVDEDKNRTCSAGLHFCSYEYLNQYGFGGRDRVVVVKINPRDVVAIPADYNNTKGRCCRYEVLRDLSKMDDMSRSVYIDAVEEQSAHN